MDISAYLSTAHKKSNSHYKMHTSEWQTYCHWRVYSLYITFLYENFPASELSFISVHYIVFLSYLALAQRALTSCSLIISHLRSCSICLKNQHDCYVSIQYNTTHLSRSEKCVIISFKSTGNSVTKVTQATLFNTHLS